MFLLPPTYVCILPTPFVFVLSHAQIHADLAILPSSAPCGKPDTQMISLLRHALLQVIPRMKIAMIMFSS